MKKRNKLRLMRFVSIFLISFGVSCSVIKPAPPIVTIIPERVEDTEISWDDQNQNGGLLDYVDGKGFEITKKALIRYNSLIFLYGKTQIPPVAENDGVTLENGRIFLSPEAMVNFMTLNKKFKNGVK